MTKPILFNTQMVKALLDGRKTVTRRVVKPQPSINASWLDKCAGTYTFSDATFPHEPFSKGDILYVRETFCTYCADHIIDGVRYAYKADATPESERIRKEYCYKYRPSIHMPREAARIFLRVTDVRSERLQGITEEQAIAEGVIIGLGGEPFFSCRDAFIDVWNRTLKKDSNCTFMHNPWVWVIEFERISKEDAYNA